MSAVGEYVMSEEEALRLTERLREAVRDLNLASALQRKERRAESTRPRHLYLIQMGDDGPVKVGIAADVESRRRTLQTAIPYPLYTRYVLPGRAHREREMHERFAYFRLSGEWFEPIPEIFDWFRMEAI